MANSTIQKFCGLYGFLRSPAEALPTVFSNAYD
ncbi:hypothetical protein HDF14_005423 [Edaphobacter lichenicola]|uniref:Uncharacterized protein n=1 Tax=Tunturiibacter gelidiferens TaxID=3069689 RepID=A0A9X0QK35_9BACT|nr:hypothetical protein [Edaphobacter lichenicola]